MIQLTKKDILSLPVGTWNGFISLYFIKDFVKPEVFVSTRWNVEIDALPPNNRYLTIGDKPTKINWVQYDVQKDCADMGDLVFEDMLMRMYRKEE